MSTHGKLVVIGQLQFCDFGGSELIAAELAELFAQRGYEVAIATRVMGSPMVEQLEGHPAVSVRLWDDPEWNAELAERDVALFWVHHHVVPPALLPRLAEFPVVFLHMSAAPLETPLVPHFERSFADAVLFNAPLTRDKHEVMGWLDAATQNRADIFPNPAPAAFFEVDRRPSSVLKRLLVVTNHLPDDLRDALARLPDSITVTQVGSQLSKGSRPARILPSHLADADAVVTIGKTVQYALAAGRPVYCYDHFGGPGWLTPENFEESRAANFSGRHVGHKDPDLIAQEMVGGYATALAAVPTFRLIAREQFHLEAAVDAVLATAQSRYVARKDRPYPRQAASDHELTQQTFSQIFVSRAELQRVARDRQAAWLDERNRNAEREREHAELTEKLRELRQELGGVRRAESQLRTRWRAQSAARRDLAARLRRAEEEASLLRVEVSRMRDSWGWRMLAPLRRLSAWSRRGRRGNQE